MSGSYRGKGKVKPILIAAAPEGAGKGAIKTEDQRLFGLWKDRDELADPALYLRNLRRPRAVLGRTEQGP